MKYISSLIFRFERILFTNVIKSKTVYLNVFLFVFLNKCFLLKKYTN